MNKLKTPWKTWAYPDGHIIILILDCEGNELADCDMDNPDNVKIAVMMTAAPELLEACKSLLNSITGRVGYRVHLAHPGTIRGCNDDVCKRLVLACDAAKQAIAKAGGDL